VKDDEGKTPLALLLDSQPEPTADNWELVMTLWKKKQEEERIMETKMPSVRRDRTVRVWVEAWGGAFLINGRTHPLPSY